MDTTAVYAERRRFLSEELLLAKEENLYENGYVLPDLPERYFAIERSSGDIVWAYGAETFESLAAAIDASETAEVDDIDVWDLDTRTAFIPAKKTVAFFRSNQRIEVGVTPQIPIQETSDRWQEDPAHPMSDWQAEVANRETVRGYQNWVLAKYEEERPCGGAE
jgi:hypothetical protein